MARFAWNWALAEWQRQYAAREDDPSLPQPAGAGLRRQLSSLKREQFPWMFDATQCAVQEAIIDLGAGFRSFFEKRTHESMVFQARRPFSQRATPLES